MSERPVRILFVCLGNICRSPLAEGVFRHLVRERGLQHQVDVDSAGTGAWHVGEPPDDRTVLVAERNGISLDGQTARRLSPDDLRRCTHVFAMDSSNLSEIRKMAAEHGATASIELFRDYDPQPGDGNVPDPYYGGADGFQVVYGMVRRTADRLIETLFPGPDDAAET